MNAGVACRARDNPPFGRHVPLSLLFWPTGRLCVPVVCNASAKWFVCACLLCEISLVDRSPMAQVGRAILLTTSRRSRQVCARHRRLEPVQRRARPRTSFYRLICSSVNSRAGTLSLVHIVNRRLQHRRFAAVVNQPGGINGRPLIFRAH